MKNSNYTNNYVGNVSHKSLTSMQKARDNLSAFQNTDTSGEGLSFFKKTIKHEKSHSLLVPTVFFRRDREGAGGWVQNEDNST